MTDPSNPNRRKKERRPIGSVPQMQSSTEEQGPHFPDFQAPELPATETVDSPAVQPSQSTEERVQQTIYLPAHLRKWLRVYAATSEQEISVIVTSALEQYRARTETGG